MIQGVLHFFQPLTLLLYHDHVHNEACEKASHRKKQSWVIAWASIIIFQFLEIGTQLFEYIVVLETCEYFEVWGE